MDFGAETQPSMPGTPLSLPPSMVPHNGAGVAFEGMASINAREEFKTRAEEANNKPVIQGLAGHVKEVWSNSLQAKRVTVEPRMFQAMRQRRGEYDPEILADIQKTGGSEIYMMLTSNKCRAAASWIRDVMTPDSWNIEHTPLPDLPPAIAKSVAAMATQEAQQYEQMTGMQVQQQDMERIVSYMKDRVVANAQKRAAEMCARMKLKMSDQMYEGHFYQAMSEFIDDIVTFPAAILKGPVVRNKMKMKWVQEAQPMPQPMLPAAGAPNQQFQPPQAQPKWQLKTEETLSLEWERVDPFMAYPAAHASDVDDGDFIQRHKLSRQALNELIGVEGYSEDAIRAVLDEFGKGGLNEWLYVDTMKAQVEGKSVAAVAQNQGGLIDSLQFWGSVQGKLLIEWGMDKAAVPDVLKDYPCEVWLIGRWVIKAMLNPDPMGRKPYFKASYEEVPGSFWGNGVTDLCRDVQSQCNVAARAIANNSGIASGPQTNVNVDRLPPGEDITQMYPWKIWQTTSDPYGSSAPPITFFQPASIAGELMQIYQFWSVLADEHTGVPRYMTGDSAAGGAGRTASGMSMMMGNAGKSIKQVISNIDTGARKPAIERLYFYNMKYSDDDELKGDVNIVVDGADVMVARENAQVRKNEFLQLALNNPTVNQIVGEEAIADILRDVCKGLDMGDLIPPAEIIRARVYQQQMAAQKQAAMTAAIANAPSEEIDVQRGPNGEMLGMTIKQIAAHNPIMPMMGIMPGPTYGVPSGPTTAQAAGGDAPAQTMSQSGQQLQDGAPQTDNFSPMRTH